MFEPSSRKTAQSVLRHSAIAMAVGLALAAGHVQAQQSAGSINGRASQGDVITIVNKAIGITRQVTVDKDGGYNASQLPAGEYVVTVKSASGSTRSQTVLVAPGKGATADFVQLEQVLVVGVANKSIDTKSTESVQSLSKAEIDRIPVSRDVTAIALLAPSATRGDGRIGNVPSLGGASPAENAYYINGFNVTNIVNGIAFNSVPFDGIATQEVKTGGYGAEYGRSLGGVISVTTKRGTDEWHGGVSLAAEPKSLRASSVYFAKDDPESTNPNDWRRRNRPGGYDLTEANFWAAGPLVKDTLYGFALVRAANEKTSIYGASEQEERRVNTPQYLLKLDWNINKNNLLELTAFNDKVETESSKWNVVKPWEAERGAAKGDSSFNRGGATQILKWTGWINDDLTVSALHGVGKYDRSSKVPTADCAFISDQRGPDAIIKGCSVVATLEVPDAGDKRTASRLDLEYALTPKHTLRAGLDTEVYDTISGSKASGTKPIWYTIKTVEAKGEIDNGWVNNTGKPLDFVEAREYVNGGQFKTENSAWYIEDNWAVSKDLLLNLGLRSESFTNKNASGVPFIKVKNTLAPRLAAAWDVKGNADLKVYSNLGRYYIPVYANTNVRLSGKQVDWKDYYAFNGSFSNDRYQMPVLGAALGERVVSSDGSTPDPRNIVDPNIKPMFQDEFIIGFQKALVDRWSAGVKYTHRVLKNSMDDICSGAGARAWAEKEGNYTAAQAKRIGAALDHCFLGNPGRDLTLNVSLDGGPDLSTVTIPNKALLFPEKPRRTYDALEFTFERAWDKKWSLAGSYVLAFSKGNTEGYVKSDIGQRDAGISQDWDYPGLMEGASGYLPNDRRHTFKAWGSYAATQELTLGANVLVQSGRPKNCLGYYNGTLDKVSIYYGSSSFYCNRELSPRGSRGRLDWTKELNLQASYKPAALKGAAFTVDLLNVFNARTVGAIEEAGESAKGSPSPDYGSPQLSSIQGPRRVRLLAQYEF